MRSEKKVNPVPPARPAKQQSTDRNVGDALRAVYREAVEEDVPDELLALLKKLD